MLSSCNDRVIIFGIEFVGAIYVEVGMESWYFKDGVSGSYFGQRQLYMEGMGLCIGINKRSSWARDTSLRLRSSGSKTGTRLSNRNCAGRRLMSFNLDDLACSVFKKCAFMKAE